MSILSAKYCCRRLRRAALGHIIMVYKTVVSRDWIYCSMVYEPKQILTWGSNSTCLDQIRKFHSPLLTVWCILSVNWVNMDQTWMSNMNFICELTIVILQLPWHLKMAKADSSTFEQVNIVTFNSVNSCNFAMWAFARKFFHIELVPCSDGWWITWW